MKSYRASLLIPTLIATSSLCAANDPGATLSPPKPVNTKHVPVETNYLVRDLTIQETRTPQADQPLAVAFDLEFEGWVYFKAKGTIPASGGVELSFADGRKIELSSDETVYPGEAMIYLSAGKHVVKATPKPGAKLQKILVRSIPESFYYCADYHHTGIPKAHPHAIVRDFQTLEKLGVIQNYNVIGSETLQDLPAYLPDATPWRKSGRKWISSAKVPRQKNSLELVENLWRKPMAITDHDGIIVDEFGTGEYYRNQFPFWSGAVDSLAERPELKGQQFYGFTGFATPEVYVQFASSLLKNGYRIAPEIYIRGVGVLNSMPSRLRRWKKAIPGIERNMVLFLGLDNRATSMTFHLQPEMNYKVFMEDQYRMMSLNKEFEGLAGLGVWVSRYLDADVLNWNARLIRHYLIEGQTARLGNDPLMMNHLVNPGFEKKEMGWTLSPAEKEGISFRAANTLPFSKTPYQAFPEGDIVLSTKRAATGPNQINQTIKGLQPGRVYHVNVYAFDPNKINRQDLIPLTVDVIGAEMISQEDAVMPTKAGKPQEFKGKQTDLYTPPVIGGTSITMHHYNRLFRATGETAELVFSDWSSAENPGGAPEEEIFWDFIELAPDESLNPPARK